MHAVGVKYALNNAKLMQMPEFTIPKKKYITKVANESECVRRIATVYWIHYSTQNMVNQCQ